MDRFCHLQRPDSIHKRTTGCFLIPDQRQEMTGFLHEQLVPLESLRRSERLPGFILNRVNTGFPACVIPTDMTVLCIDLHPMRGGLLEVIQMDSADYPAPEFQKDFGHIFHIQFEPRNLTGHRAQGVNLSKQPAQVIQWMAEGVDHTAAQISPGSVPLAVILPGMPSRQVFAPMGADGERISLAVQICNRALICANTG